MIYMYHASEAPGGCLFTEEQCSKLDASWKDSPAKLGKISERPEKSQKVKVKK